MIGPQHDRRHAPDEAAYETVQLASFMQAYSYAVGLGEAGDAAAGLRLLQSHLEELRHNCDAAPAGLLDLWEIGLIRYEDQFLGRAKKSPEGS